MKEESPLEKDLCLSNLQKEFFLKYQPIIAVESLDLIGFEAFAYKRDSSQGFIFQADFIPIEATITNGLALNWRPLQEACQKLKIWQKLFPKYRNLSLDVHISGQQFFQSSFIAELDVVLSVTGLAGQYLKLEISETAFMANVDLASTILRQLKLRHIELWINDFVPDRTPFQTLHRLEVNTLKISHAYIAQLNSNPASVEVLNQLLMQCQQLKMNVIARGIQTPALYWQLKRLKCPWGQGSVFVKPLTPEAVAQLLSHFW
jgi:EAL domain-containing protein (putative c-di-GMP-specific phosphodiesterase class I)